MISLGIDIGSRNTKICLYDIESEEILYTSYCSTEVNPIDSVKQLLAAVPNSIDISAITHSAVTGYGRHLWKDASKTLSEISCHAAGICHLIPGARTIIDIGGQDSKIISLDDNARVVDFVMNDKCAAGTGRFLEMTAMRLGLGIDQLSMLATQSDQDYALSSTCVVFAESEIIGLMSQAVSPANIARSVNRSIAKRIHSQMAGLANHEPIVFTGGVAQSADIRYCLERELKLPLMLPPDPEITGALGAAILAGKK